MSQDEINRKIALILSEMLVADRTTDNNRVILGDDIEELSTLIIQRATGSALE